MDAVRVASMFVRGCVGAWVRGCAVVTGIRKRFSYTVVQFPSNTEFHHHLEGWMLKRWGSFGRRKKKRRLDDATVN